MLVKSKSSALIKGHFPGYIAGDGDGIVTVKGKPSARCICLFDAINARLLATSLSLKNGHYMFLGLDPAKEYLVMVRDLRPNGTVQRYEPFAWDYVKPANDLTIDEQMTLQASWQ